MGIYKLDLEQYLGRYATMREIFLKALYASFCPIAHRRYAHRELARCDF